MFKEFIIDPVLSSIQNFGSRNAFCIREEYFSYNQFGHTISMIRDAIHDAVSFNANVGLVINDDIETYSSVFALWLEGRSYVPLHPNWPLERCKDIIEQVNLDLVLDSSEKSRYSDVNIIKTSVLLYKGDNLSYDNYVSDDDLAYILFTSGSTGKPKGVQISRNNIGSFMDGFWKSGIKINEKDRCLQAFDMSFDVSVQGFLVPLCKGACCYSIPYDQIKYLYVSRLIENHKITFGAMAPSMLRYLKPYFDEFDSSSLKQCILTAEACPLSLMEEWCKYAPNVQLYDFYGPTEATIYCTYYKFNRDGYNKSLNGIVSIGRPMANIIALILDENGEELPNGEKGELCVAGKQITKGYYNNFDKNSEAFFEKEINNIRLRFYHTGDLCYKDDEGDIMYSGRMDHQAKIQGFRVEMGEIEYHARIFLKGANVVCMAYDNNNGLSQIAMFIEGNEENEQTLLNYLRSKVPQYMIPSKIYYLSSFPLNENAKTDKKKLRSMIY